MNKLPELPYDPKYLKCPLEDSRHSTYRETSLERDYKFELLTGIDVGVTLDLVDMSSFAVPKNPPPLDPVDQQLIAGSTKQGGKQHIPAPFILHPQYSTTDSSDTRIPLGVNLAKENREEQAMSLEDEHEKQITNIIASFESTLVPPKHPTNPKLKPVHIYPLLPDEDLWGNEYSEVVFDTDPVLKKEDDISPEECDYKRKNAIIKSVSLPGDDTTCLRYFTTKRRRLDPDDQPELEQEQEYEYVREYKYRIYPGDGENYLFVMKEGVVTYQEVRMKVMMQKVTKESNPYGQGRIFLKKVPTLSENAQQQLDNARLVLQDASAQTNSVLSPHEVYPGPSDSCYQFTCSYCDDDGKSSLIHTQKSWSDIAVTALHNLERLQKIRFFTESDICTYIEDHWDQLCIGKSKSSTWPTSIANQLSSRTNLFELSDEDDNTYALLHPSPEDPKPSRTKHLKTSSGTGTSGGAGGGGDTPSAGKKKSKHKKESMDDGGFMWCHQCKQKHVQVLYCSRTCSKKYCTRCVKRHYREKVEEIDLSQWVCYYCQGICTCAFCRRRRAKETNTKFESHRGKKRRIESDLGLDDVVLPKKRKIKSLGSSDHSDSYTPTKGKGKHDDWIVEDDDDLALRPSPSPPPKRNIPKSRLTSNLSRRHQRVTLKDLLDANLVAAGDELSFRNTPTRAVLLSEGHIRWNDTVYRSLSTFAKKAAHCLGLGTHGTLYNGWRVVYCRGKVMDEFRNLFLLKFSENNSEDFLEKTDEENSEYNGEEVGVEDSEGDVHPPVDESDDPNVEDEEDDDEGGTGDRPVGVHVTEESADSTGGESGGESVRESFVDSGTESPPGEVVGEAERKETGMENFQLDLWWHHDDSAEDDEEVETSPVHHLDDLLPVSSTTLEDEQDALIMGPFDSTSLDIRDKDFFDVSSMDDMGGIGSYRPTSSHLEDSVRHPFVTETDEFYSGGMGIDMDD